MAKGIYVGVDNVARKVKKAYVGVSDSNSMVANGDFEDGVEGWLNGYSAYASLTAESDTSQGGCARFEVVAPVSTTALSWGYFYQEVSVIVGHKYYISCLYKGESTNYSNQSYGISLFGWGTNKYYIVNNTDGDAQSTSWNKLSGIGECTETATARLQLRMYIGAPDSNITAGMGLWYDDVKMYDLTAMYGAGNEPTQEWCDTNTSALESLYKRQNGKARKVKKGYIGVGGVARLFFSSEKELSYYGTAANLSVARSNLAATSVGNYAIFGGGEYPDGATNAVNCYSTQLTVNNSLTVNFTKCDLAATTVGNYALFGGGTNRTTSGVRSEVVSIDSLLTSKNITDLSDARFALAATTVGDYALFGGGRGRSTSYVYDTVDSYTSELVQGTPTVLSSERYNLAATTVGDYALFAGGQKSSYYATVDTYTSTLVKGTATDLSEARGSLAATSVGDYALFAGGQYTSTAKTTVDSYTSSLVKGTPAALSVQRTTLAATTVGGYALFGGGRTATTGTYKATVDTYNESLVKSTTTDLSVAREILAATTVGDYALFAGGSDSSGYSATVDVYQAI